MIISKIPNPIRIVFYFTIILIIIEFFLPFEASVGSSLYAKTLTIAFYFILNILIIPIKPIKLDPKHIKMPTNRGFNYIRIVTLLSPVLLFIDRVYVRGYDISLGIASLRYQMEANATGGISSMFSVLGYLGCAMAFVLLTRLVIFPSRFTFKLNYLDAFLIMYSVFGVSLITGGRTTLFLLVGFIYTSLYCRVNILNYKIVVKVKTLRNIFLLFGVMLFYVTYVFQQRAEANNFVATDYYSTIINHLHGKEKIDSNLKSNSDLYIYSQLTLAYFVHQYWILQETLELPDSFKTGSATFISWKVILSKTGLFNKPVGWYYGGFYIPLIGSFIYDFGVFLGLIISLFLFFSFYYISIYMLKKQRSLNWFVMINYVGFVIIFSTVLPSIDIMMSPILIISFTIILPIISFLSKLSLR